MYKGKPKKGKSLVENGKRGGKNHVLPPTMQQSFGRAGGQKTNPDWGGKKKKWGRK